jgi:excisionase family DNA binding protein
MSAVATTKPLAMRRKTAAKALGIGTTKLDELIAEGQIAALKCGKVLLILTSELERYVATLPAAQLNYHKHKRTLSTARGTGDRAATQQRVAPRTAARS